MYGPLDSPDIPDISNLHMTFSNRENGVDDMTHRNYRNILLAIIVAFVIVPTIEISCDAKDQQGKTVMKSHLAGSWYPGSAEKLNMQLADFSENAATKPKDNVIALILPHAGYKWSGQTAAFGIKSINRKFKRIIVIGPSHHITMADTLSVPNVTHYQTPLGQTPLDRDFIDKLLKHSIFQNIPRAHTQEHSVQIELPLLQYAQKDFELVPIVTGQCSFETVERAANILRSLIDADTLVVASSDFVHYGRRFRYVPFTENIPAGIKKLDMGAYEHIAALDARAFFEYRKKTGATICGYIPVAILLSMLDKPVKVELAKYATSGELLGDYSNSVSYLSVVFSGAWPPGEKNVEPEPKSELSKTDKQQLLKLARKTIIYYLENNKAPTPSDLGIKPGPAMKTRRAAFVTLKKQGRLRGCIGDIIPRSALCDSVIRNAINATVNDRRFRPVTRPEADELTIEISALTVPKSVASAADIRIGADGVILRKGRRRAVYLPQVAPEQGWGIEETLTHLSVKAGLPADAWKNGAEFQVFQAEVFGENEL